MSAKAVLGRALRETGAALKQAGGVEVRAGSRTRHRKRCTKLIKLSW